MITFLPEKDLYIGILNPYKGSNLLLYPYKFCRKDDNPCITQNWNTDVKHAFYNKPIKFKIV